MVALSLSLARRVTVTMGQLWIATAILSPLEEPQRRCSGDRAYIYASDSQEYYDLVEASHVEQLLEQPPRFVYRLLQTWCLVVNGTCLQVRGRYFVPRSMMSHCRKVAPAALHCPGAGA